MSAPFELPIRVAPADIDALGHVNNVTYLRWVQDAAVAHWTAEAPADEQARLFWIVLRHEIDYRHPAQLGDALVARTWVGSASRLRFERHTEIVRAEDGRVLAGAYGVVPHRRRNPQAGAGQPGSPPALLDGAYFFRARG